MPSVIRQQFTRYNNYYMIKFLLAWPYTRIPKESQKNPARWETTRCDKRYLKTEDWCEYFNFETRRRGEPDEDDPASSIRNTSKIRPLHSDRSWFQAKAKAAGCANAVAHPNSLPDTMDSTCGWRRYAVRALNELLDELIDDDDFVLDCDDGAAVAERPSAPESNRLDDLLDWWIAFPASCYLHFRWPEGSLQPLCNQCKKSFILFQFWWISIKFCTEICNTRWEEWSEVAETST